MLQVVMVKLSLKKMSASLWVCSLHLAQTGLHLLHAGLQLLHAGLHLGWRMRSVPLLTFSCLQAS